MPSAILRPFRSAARIVVRAIKRRAVAWLGKVRLERLTQAEAALAVRWVSSAHRRLHAVQWDMAPQPEHYDHMNDLYFMWRETRNALWVERGVFASLALRGGDVLELCCGDGFNARNFYSLRSRRVVACDFDPLAIQTAHRKNAAPNVEFRLADIRTQMPEGIYENIIWDAAIEHFTPAETAAILSGIRARLVPGGILAGYTIVEKPTGEKSLSHHEYEFRDMADLRRFLAPHFKRVTVFETEYPAVILHDRTYPARHNLYFYASDGTLPFDGNWSHVVRAADAPD